MAGFGDEWSRFDQSGVQEAELRRVFDAYFALFPWHDLPPSAVGADIGCGSGRWASFVSDRVGRLICVDPSPHALNVARRNLADRDNVEYIEAGAGDLPIEDDSLDFAYSLGVLHHTPDPQAALADCVSKLKPGAPMLVYLYYAFDNRPSWFRALWRVSDAGRRFISRLPHRPRFWVTQVIAGLVYWPLARAARVVERVTGRDVDTLPLSAYRDRPFYIMRNDALDRFGTQLEARFTGDEIHRMMYDAGLIKVHLGDQAPYWCAIGRRL